jgi:polar amino acid transport system substrate-binding protein
MGCVIRASIGEEEIVKLSTRWAALAAVTVLMAACSSGGGASSAPTQGPVTQAPATQTPPSAAPTDKPIAPPTSLITAGKIVDCVDIEYPPMEFFPSADVTDPNQAVGFDVEAAKAVAAKLGLAIEIRNTGFDQLIPDLTAGRCDIVWSALYVSASRLEVADAIPYMATGQVVMVPAGNPKAIKSVDDLCGKTISIQSGGLVEERANAASTACTDGGKAAIAIQGYKLVSDELQQIVLGRVDAVWETDTAVSDWMIKNPGKYEVAYALTRDDNYGVYYVKGKGDVGAALSIALNALLADGSLAAIAETYEMDPAILVEAIN